MIVEMKLILCTICKRLKIRLKKLVGYHHRIFIWLWMEIETETHIEALDLAPWVQMRSRRRENMSKKSGSLGVRPPTETVGLI